METLSLGLLKKAKERSAINRLETGISDIKVSTLSKLLNAYGVTITEVFVEK